MLIETTYNGAIGPADGQALRAAQLAMVVKNSLCGRLDFAQTENTPGGMSRALTELGRYLEFGQRGTFLVDGGFRQKLEELSDTCGSRFVSYNNGMTVRLNMPSGSELWEQFCYCRQCRREPEAGGGLLGAWLMLVCNGRESELRGFLEHFGLLISVASYDLKLYGRSEIRFRDDPVLYFYILGHKLCGLLEQDKNRSFLAENGSFRICPGQDESREDFWEAVFSAMSRIEIRMQYDHSGEIKFSVDR